MSVGALSPQQLRSIVEEKWQRDEDALAVGLHVTAAWAGPDEVEFDFGKARVVRADTVFAGQAGVAGRRASQGPDHPADQVAAGGPGARCRRPAGPLSPLRHRPLGDPLRPVPGQGTRPFDLRSGHRPGPDRIRPARWLPARLGGHPRRRDGLACPQPTRFRYGRERARPGVATALGDHEIRLGPLPGCPA